MSTRSLVCVVTRGGEGGGEGGGGRQRGRGKGDFEGRGVLSRYR